MIQIRPMIAEDVGAIAQLEAANFSLPWDDASIRGELDNPLSFWLVALCDNKVVGYVGTQTVMGEADMLNLAVDQQYRRHGIARALVEELIRYLKTRDVAKLLLEVRVSNEPAVKLYEKMGFSVLGRRPRYYQRPKEDAWILGKELA